MNHDHKSYGQDPDQLYREILFNDGGSPADSGADSFTVLGRPGESLQTSLQPGDLLLRVALGEPGMGHLAVLSDAALLTNEQMEDAPFRAECDQPGSYALVSRSGAFPAVNGDRIGRRILDSKGRLLPGQLLLRSKPAFSSDSGAEFSTLSLEGVLVDEEPFDAGDSVFDEEAGESTLQNITHAGPYRLAYDRIKGLGYGVIQPLPGRNTRRFRGTLALQNALNAWAPYIEKVMPPPNYILTGGLTVNKPGEHGRGTAIDVDGFWWSSTNKFLANDAPTDWFRYLTIEATLRKVFGTVLNYDYNAAHQDHWHCDLGRPTRWRSVRSQANFAQRALNVIWGESLVVDGKWGSLSKAAALRNGYDFFDADGWDRFLDDIINRQSSLPSMEAGESEYVPASYELGAGDLLQDEESIASILNPEIDSDVDRKEWWVGIEDPDEWLPETEDSILLTEELGTHLLPVEEGQYAELLAEDLSRRKLEKALRLNRKYATELWQKYEDSIGIYLARTLRRMPPVSEEGFAYNVARWQRARGLKEDGILGPTTWKSLAKEMGIFVPDLVFKPEPVKGRVNSLAVISLNQFLEDPQDRLLQSVNDYWQKYRDGLNAFAFGMVFKAPGLDNSSTVWDILVDLTFTVINYTFPLPEGVDKVITGSQAVIDALRKNAKQQTGERAISDYYSGIVNLIGREDGPQKVMQRQALHAKNIWMPAIVNADDQAAAKEDVIKAVEAFETAVNRLTPAHFTRRFAEQFIKRFDGGNRNAVAGRVSQGARRVGRLYLPVKISVDDDGFAINQVGKRWVLATSASKPTELAATLSDALAKIGKGVTDINLPRSIDINIWRGWSKRSIQLYVLCYGTRCGLDRVSPINLYAEGQKLYTMIWRDPLFQKAIRRVNELKATNVYEEF